MSTPYKFIQSRADFGKAIGNWFKKNDWPQSITESVAKEVNEWEGGPWASQQSTAINGKLDPKATYFIASGCFNKYIHEGDFKKIKDQSLKEKLQGSKAFTHNNGRPFDGADFFRLFTGLIEVPKKYKVIEGSLSVDSISEYQELMMEHTQKIKREEFLGAKEFWKKFTEQQYAQTLKKEHLIVINDVLRGDLDLTKEQILEFAKAYGKCPVMPPLQSMADIKPTKRLKELNGLIEARAASDLKLMTKTRQKPKTSKANK
tara:strand:+ start:1473 stop:2252 length:780 start_codon:yes stop_codon:yes gene_type:complete